jgi:DNA-binding NtrC family response regulator
VTIDCGSSSENLIESDLFGHVRGAFTGADRDHIGKLDRVGNGTILLDEIDSLPLSCQSRLLRVLEERVFEKLGGEHTQAFGGRVIALTNKSLEQEVAQRRFRQDLFYRLNVITFEVPPLRERRDDIRLLLRYFVEQFAERNEVPPAEISDEAMAAMTAHSWPGNIRELRNVVERAVALSGSQVITPRHLNLPPSSITRGATETVAGANRLSDVRLEAERRELISVLRLNDNNRTRAAEHLGISRSALYKRLEKLGLT